MTCRRCFGTGIRYWPVSGGFLVSQACETCGGNGER